MTGSGTETLTAALRRLADEHASGLLSVVTADRGDVVLELADGVPVGIGPALDVSGRVGRDANAGLVAAAVVDELMDLTVAAIVGGGGDWTWDVESDAAMMPLPPGLATELTRRAVDAAQALAELDPEIVLQPARPLETHGEVGRVRELFDGERRLEEVAELADLTVPATATHAKALVAAGVLSTGAEPEAPPSWTDAVAGSGTDEDDDEPELWVMDPPDDEDEHPEELEGEQRDASEPALGDTTSLGDHVDLGGASDLGSGPDLADGPGPDDAVDDQSDDLGDHQPATTSGPGGAPDVVAHDQPEEDDEDDEMAWVAPGEDDTEVVEVRPRAAATDDDGWDDTDWLDDLDTSPDDEAPVHTAGDERPQDARAALSSMLTDLQGPAGGREQPAAETPATSASRAADEPDDEPDEPRRATPSPRRKEPKAEPGEVAEFLRELSRLALDDE